MSNIKLLYGTTNKAKIMVMENVVRDLAIELISLNELQNLLFWFPNPIQKRWKVFLWILYQKI